jgi:hypothetical protein
MLYKKKDGKKKEFHKKKKTGKTYIVGDWLCGGINPRYHKVVHGPHRLRWPDP